MKEETKEVSCVCGALQTHIYISLLQFKYLMYIMWFAVQL